MKVVWMMHDIVLTDDIQDILDELGIIGLSRWKRMTGRGPKSGARMDTHVWPGANSGAFVVVEDEMAARLMGRLQILRDEVGGMTGVWAFTTPVLETLRG
ncbi:MAG: hypothetical protein GX548_01295 [Lentisphaerae bacterium]|nr:hypothetical protein [Lentisphaerota bacterium]